VKIEPAFLQALVALAALMAGLYGVVTRPLLKRMDDIRADLLQFKTEVRGEFAGMRADLKDVSVRLARVEERLPPPLVHR